MRDAAAGPDSPRRVCVVTGARSEYGILRPVMREIARRKILDLSVVAAGMHLSRDFGHTVDEIVADGFPVAARVDMLPRKDTQAAMAHSVGRGVTGFTAAFLRLAPDIVLVLGDRTEAFAAATAAALSGRLVAHVHGGDRAEAGYDDYMRHAITKMAHLHFAATAASARRIARLGEPRNRIFTVGAPGLDEIRSMRLPSSASVKRALGFPASSPLVLCVEHSVSTRPEAAAAEMTATLEALARTALPTVLVYPNSDAGGRAIIEVARRFEAAHGLGRGGGWLAAFASLPRARYLAVMKAASVMVGNSSSGIIEAASFGLPVINVGRRQAGRERCGNTIDVAASRAAILRALRRVFSDCALRARLQAAQNVYGDGRASARIADVLAGLEITSGLYAKRITY